MKKTTKAFSLRTRFTLLHYNSKKYFLHSMNTTLRVLEGKTLKVVKRHFMRLSVKRKDKKKGQKIRHLQNVSD